MAEKDKKTTNLTIETSAEDKAVLDMLSSKDMTINRDSVQELCASWVSKVNDLDLNTNAVTTSFKPLIESKILEDYLKRLSSAVNSLTANVQNITFTLIKSSDSHEEVESGEDNEPVSEKRNKDARVTIKKITKNEEIEEENNSRPIIKEISNQDSLGLSIVLYKDKNTLDEIFKDEKALKNLKSKIASSHFISKELKNKLNKLDDRTLLFNLKNMNSKKMLIAIEGASFINDYFKKVASQNNKTKKELFEEVKNKELVYNKLYFLNKANEYINKEIKTKNYNDKLLNTYNGGNNKLNDEITYAFRMVVDILSEKKKTNGLDFLTRCQIGDFDEAVKSLSISSYYINSETDKLQELLYSILGGE